jgi:hypothetical protein
MGGIDHGPRHKTPDPPPVYVHHTTVAGGTSDTTCANVNPGTTMGAACAATTGLDHMRALDDPAGADKAAQAQRESDVKKIGEAAAYLTAAIVAAGVVGPLVRPAGAATAQALSDAKALLVWAAGSVSYHLDRCTNAASGGCGTVAKSPLWKSVKRFGHTFSKHGAGAKNARALADRARSTGKPQGQWLDNQAASNLLKEITAEGPLSLRIPEGLGQVIRADGTTVPATWARVVPSADGIRTAFPILVE